MLRNRLAELLAERNLKISRVANDIPNLSRNTITSTAQNDSKMIQLETINSLCQYLGVSPNEFLEYIPFDINVSSSLDIPENVVITPGDVNSYLKLCNISMDLFMKQTSNLEEAGERTKTFDLTVMLSPKIEIPFSDIIDEMDDSDNKIEFQVFLGHLDDTDTFNKQESDFSTLWSKQLTPGFRAIIQKNMMNTVTQEFTSQIDELCKFAREHNFPNAHVNWKEIKFTFNFTFDNAFENHKNENTEPEIEFYADSLPF